MDRNCELVQSFGTYLLGKVTTETNPAKKHVYAYSVAQITPIAGIPLSSVSQCIDSCIVKENYPLAFSLIERLFESKPAEALGYLTSHHDRLFSSLRPDTPLSQAYARKLLLTPTGTWTTLSMFSAPSKARYQQAAAIFPQLKIENETLAAHFFAEYVAEGKWEDALSLLQKRKEKRLSVEIFNRPSMETLAAHFCEEGERLYNEGHALRSEDFARAEALYRHSLQMKEHAAVIINNDTNRFQVNIHRRLLARIIIESDNYSKCLTEKRTVEALDFLKQIELNPCTGEDPHFNEIYLDVLGHHISFLHNNCLTTNFGASAVCAAADHKAHCQDSINRLIGSIDKALSLRKNSRTADNPKQMAALYFMKAEYIDYFALEGSALSNYQKARELAPTQPFYHLRYSETLPDATGPHIEAARQTGGVLLKECGMEVSDYMSWFDERWKKTKFYNVSLPEAPLPKPTGILAGFGFGA
jgi:tetratricopeptide (TPR) repeat protein